MARSLSCGLLCKFDVGSCVFVVPFVSIQQSSLVRPSSFQIKDKDGFRTRMAYILGLGGDLEGLEGPGRVWEGTQ